MARSWMSRAAISHARTPTKASFGAGSTTGTTVTDPPSLVARVSGTKAGCVNRFQAVSAMP